MHLVNDSPNRGVFSITGQTLSVNITKKIALTEGREGVKWELGFAFFGGWEMGFCALGLGFMKNKNNRKVGMGFQFEQHRLGLWDLSWDSKKTISPSRPS